MADTGLDQLVKGSPPTNVNLSERSTARSTPQPSDPTSLLPSSPPQIYLNLLILEASLRSQYLTLRARRRQHTFVLIVLCVWTTYFFYGQFLRPREDGTGVGGSVYWLVDMTEKVALISGCVMGILFWVTGQWERGIRWPRRWMGVTNRGLRGMNCKVVVLKGPWWREMLSHMTFLLPISSFVPTPGSNYRYIEYTSSERKAMHQHGRTPTTTGKEFAEEDIAAGGDYIMVLLLAKHFTPEFRENWEIYRAEYWEAENARRAELRKRIAAKERAMAKKEGGLLWWTGWRGWARAKAFTGPKPHELEKIHHHSHASLQPASMRDRQRRAVNVLKEKEGSHSRSSSRSSVSNMGPGSGPGPGLGPGPGPDHEERERRWSTSTTSSIGGDKRRKKIMTTTEVGRRPSVTTRVKLTPASSSRPVTPTTDTISLRSRASNLSALSSGSDGDSPGRRMASDITIKTEPAD